jgi:pimeloyl-ACP methyl ester carboxylesterase
MKTDKRREYSIIRLPLTDLHYVTMGEGEPLIIVPATISSIDNWLDLIAFMAQKFRVHFFELPGHGKSTPFASPYTSLQVAHTVEHLMDALHFPSVSIMGFSFGGILTMTTLHAIGSRINRVILFAPCISHHALQFSWSRLEFIRAFEAASEQKRVQALLLSLMHNRQLVPYVVHALEQLGKIENSISSTLDQKLLTLPESTLEVLIAQIHEIITVDFPFGKNEFSQPCFFGMSTRDPLLKYDVTHDLVSQWFPNLITKTFDTPYHQPPKPLTFDQLNASYGYLLGEMGT